MIVYFMEKDPLNLFGTGLTSWKHPAYFPRQRLTGPSPLYEMPVFVEQHSSPLALILHHGDFTFSKTSYAKHTLTTPRHPN